MPELPEVETIRRELTGVLVGARIRSAVAGRADVIGFPDPGRFCRGVAGRRVRGLRRRGKYLILELDQDKELVFHLRLSGHLELCEHGQRPRFERVRFVLGNGNALSFVEPRALGRVYLVSAGRYPAALRGMTQMGREPIEPGFGSDYLAERLRGRRAPVKSVLLDQRVCCGVGNIYSDEALFRAGVRPSRPAGRLSSTEVRRLASGLARVLRDGIRWCGTTLGDGRYLRPGTERGGFQKRLKVFGRDGKGCRTCGDRVKRVKIGSRSSYFCPTCQK